MPVETPEVDKSQDQEEELRNLLSRGGLGRAYAQDTDAAPVQPPESASGTAPDTGTPAAPVAASAAPPAALGNAYREPMGPPVPPELQPGQAVSPAAKSLTEFSLATGANVAPPKSHLDQVQTPPQAPTMSPDYAATQADLRAKSGVTPKYDPQTGQTLDKYKPSVGSRIGRAFLDAGRGFLYGGLGGMVAAPLEGAFGNKNSPGYYGKGAVGGQYFKDEAQRQRDVAADTDKIKSFEAENTRARDEFKDKNDVYKDAMGQAYKQDVGDLKQQGADEKAKQDKAIDDLKQQANDLKDQLRSITYDPQKKQFMRGDQVYTPKDFQEGAVLETQHGIQNGQYTQRWLQERKNQPVQIHTGDKGFSAADQLRLKSYAKSNNIKLKSLSPEDISDAMSQQQVDEALSKKYTDPGDSTLRGDALKNFKADTEVQSIDTEMKKLDEQRALLTEGLGVSDPAMKKQAQEGLAGVDQRMQDLSTRRNAARDKYVQQQNKRQEPATPAKTQAPASQPVTQPKLTPIPDKQMKSPGGRVYKVGDTVSDGKGGQQTIKGFAKSPDGKVHATF